MKFGPRTPELLEEARRLVEEHGGIRAAARASGIPQTTLRGRWEHATGRGPGIPQKKRATYQNRDDGRPTSERPVESQPFANSGRDFEVPEIPSPHAPIEETIRRLCEDYERTRAHHDATRLIRVKVNVEGPIGLLVFGDPHLGSPHTDWPAIRRNVELTQKVDGLYGTNIGDTGDNWSGKLARLWADNEISHATEYRLSEWFMKSVRWLLWVYGNHDVWTMPGNPLSWMARHAGVELTADWSQRLELVFPNQRGVRIGIHHGANGHSLWNPGHGVLKETRIGTRDHLVCGGHIHQSFVLGPTVDPHTLEWSYGLQIGSFKNIPGHFGKRIGGSHQNAFPAAVVIIDPEATRHSGLISIYPDTELGADVLTFMRRRRAQGRRYDA